MNGFIATLGMGLIIKGYLDTNYKGTSGDVPWEFQLIGATGVGPIPVSTIIMLVVALLAALFLSRTRTGNHMFAVGGNEQVARLSGIRTAQPIIVAHVLCSVTAAFAGLLLASRLGVGSPTVGIQGGYDLLSIAAVVLGGTILAGGRGSVWGTIGGVAIFAVLDNVMSVLQVNPFMKDVVRGVVIVAAVAVYTARQVRASSGQVRSGRRGGHRSGCRSVAVRQSLGVREGRVGMKIVSALVSPRGAVFLLLAVLLIAITVLNPNFAEPGQLMRFIQRVAPVAIVAIGQYFVIVGGEFDLSMGSVVTAQVVIAGNLVGQEESRTIPVLFLMLAFGVLVGLVNGLIVSFLRVPSFIATLGMMLALLGGVLYWTGGAATGNPDDSFRQIGRGGIRDVPVLDLIPWSVLILIVVLAAAIWFSKRPFGRTIIALGDNPTAAGFAGVRTWWVKTSTFILSSLSATARRHPARRLRRRAPLRRPGLRVHGHHGRRARRRRPRRRARLGRRRSGRGVRPRGAVHPAQLRRGPVDAARRHPGRHHHRRRRLLRRLVPRSPSRTHRCRRSAGRRR